MRVGYLYLILLQLISLYFQIQDSPVMGGDLGFLREEDTHELKEVIIARVNKEGNA